MKTVVLKGRKWVLIQKKHFQDKTTHEIRDMADYVATHGKSYRTDTGTIAIVKYMNGSDHVVILKEGQSDKDTYLTGKTFYRDTDGGVKRRIRIGQWW